MELRGILTDIIVHEYTPAIVHHPHLTGTRVAAHLSHEELTTTRINSQSMIQSCSSHRYLRVEKTFHTHHPIIRIALW